MNRTWHETAWTEPEPGPDLGPVQQVQVPNLGPEPNFGIASSQKFTKSRSIYIEYYYYIYYIIKA